MPSINTKTKDEIIVRILNSLEQNASITATSPGSIARAFADAFGTEMFYLYESFKEAVSQTNLSTASGRGLDLIGEMYNVKRKTLSDQLVYERTTANIEFILDKPYTSDIIIPKGTLVYNDVGSYNSTQYSYKLSNDVAILAGVTKAYGIVTPNFQSNDHVASVGSLTRHNFIGPAGVILFCTNPKEVYPVINAESDDNYRRRILSAVKVSATGTVEALRFAALSVNGVKDVRIREGSFGLGSCEIIVVPEVPGRIGNIPTIVNSAISEIRPLGIRINISAANPLPVSVNATITLPYGTNENLRVGIQNQASLFVKRYLNSLTIGDTMSIQEVERQIRISSDLIRSINITNITAQGTSINRKDFRAQTERDYIVSGDISINSVIIGVSNY
jgi:uncharacterized phage protein gp47/JayE